MRRSFTLTAGLLVRGIALFLAAFTALGLVGELRGRASDLGLWFVDLRDLTRVLQVALLVGFGGALAIWALAKAPGRGRRGAAAIACLGFAILAGRDVARYASAVGSGQVRPLAPVPLSLVIAFLLVAMAAWIWRGSGSVDLPRWRARLAVATVSIAAGIAFPVVQIGFFGTTDYRRPADAAVILGARVYASGAPSPLLADRIATGVELYQARLVKVLIMSGGDGADGFNEAAVMREQAIAAGVDPDAILVDKQGVNTDASVEHTLVLIADHVQGPRPVRLIAVSQAYHLPRIQLAFSGAGVDVLTVPAVDPVPISEMPLLVAREIPAFWLYYLRACLG